MRQRHVNEIKRQTNEVMILDIPGKAWAETSTYILCRSANCSKWTSLWQ